MGRNKENEKFNDNSDGCKLQKILIQLNLMNSRQIKINKISFQIIKLLRIKQG